MFMIYLIFIQLTMLFYCFETLFLKTDKKKKLQTNYIDHKLIYRSSKKVSLFAPNQIIPEICEDDILVQRLKSRID